MTARDLLKKYNDTLTQIAVEAADSVNEAQADLKQRTADHEKAQQHLQDLKDTMDKNHDGFLGAAKAILGMAYRRPQTPADIDNAILPILTYQSALAAVPAAEKSCDDANAAQNVAQAELNAAVQLHSTFSNMIQRYEK